jgi:hypothetical protein
MTASANENPKKSVSRILLEISKGKNCQAARPGRRWSRIGFSYNQINNRQRSAQ